MSNVATEVVTEHTPLRTVSRFNDVLTMADRCVRLTSRNMEVLLTSLMLPVMIMLLFVYLFGGAIETGTSSYVTYFLPGALLLCVGYGAALTAVSVSQDMKGGIVDRFRSMNVSGAALLGGHVFASIARNLAATILVIGVAFLIGFRTSADWLHWLGAAAVLLLFVLAFSWLAATIGLLVKSPEAASGFGFFMMFLPYPSSAFVPINTMPSWIHGFAQYQPVTPVIESLRGLLLGAPMGNNLWLALAWCGGILIVSVILSGVLFARRTA
jgi:ABC-2 type transport system permease protein